MMKLCNRKNKLHSKSAFTIIEILVSIAIVGILAAITIVSYNGYQNSIITATLKSDLNGVSAAMENARNFSNAYPVDITTLSTIKPSSGVVLSGGSIDGKIYCVTATSSQNTTLSYFINSSSNSAQQGACISTTAPTLTATVASSTSINLSWTLVINATSYTLQRDTNTSFSGATTIATPSGSTSSFTSTGLTSGTTYYYRVRASNVSGNGVWSATASATTPFTYVLTTIAGTGGSVNSGGTYNSGSTPTITATPSTNYSFSSWSGSTGCSGVASHTITMDANKSCTANFTPTYVLTTIASTGGSVSSGGTYNVGSTPTITATPNANYSFSSWSGDTGCSGVASHTITMDTNKTCTANFVPTPIAAPAAPTVAANTSGATTTWSWGAASCPGNTARYQYDYTITPSGYDSGWVSNGSNLSVAFTTSTSGQTYTVNVQAQCYNAVTSSSWSGSGSARYSTSAFSNFAVSDDHSCAIASDNQAYCWGYNWQGQLGNNSNTSNFASVAVYTGGALSGKTIKSIAVGNGIIGGGVDGNSCAIASDNQAYCWGGGFGTVPVAVTGGALSGKTILP